MFLITNTALFSEETAAETIEMLTTEYSAVKVPAINMIVMGVSMVILIAAAIAALVFIRNRTQNWFSGIITGVTAYLLLSVTWYLSQLGIGLIPAARTYLTEHETFANIIFNGISVIIECLVVLLGMFYLKKQGIRRNKPMNIGGPFAFGLAFFASMLIFADQITLLIQELMYSSMINTNGFDVFYSELVATGVSEEEALSEMLALTGNEAFSYLWNALGTICGMLAVTGGAVLTYGVLTEKLEKKWLLAAMGIIVLSNASTFIYLFKDSMLLSFLVSFVVAAGSTIVVSRLVNKYMTDDIKMMLYTRQQQKKDEEAQKKKMPKIVMPKD